MNKWTLPASLKVGGADFEIRTDFRIVLGIFKWLKKDDLPEAARFSIVLKALYVDVDKIRQEDTLNNSSTCQRARYSSATVAADHSKLFVRNTISRSFPSTSTFARIRRSGCGYDLDVRTPVSRIVSSESTFFGSLRLATCFTTS